ncbi:MAG: prepilin-type N-terminal cleavage/methylation domain-containing protein [Nitrospina sp.]|jgi:prepilin-type N-terminal cleavage/methylation domain-containing protein|nr:prepilin-type N-terminal cleavage/methylation domain-containing protein [Nitrospina sp.]MBT3416304.1 prepilin-type N-terminal cleavage/methylation domain-containing protein [Nitrospina sp.]MBT3856725.1 prepilin-type N-terminal cleavage/methylation domain-containing protein [Nitrospina sp.]MBT4105370.1 prepilin-type N-terminal cleavage/methylation domain-containing protein [Nitrospina sp.]MBT4390638.1 prepilin-type N-terminal cleavage/methylation domain-containing protein [Nitrospina sp.]
MMIIHRFTTEPDSKRRKAGAESGFTLVEIVMAMVVMGILGVFSVQLISNAARTSQLSAGQKDLVDEAKLAMEFMIRELRMADNRVDAITLTATSIQFTKLSAYEQDTNLSQILYSYNSGTGKITRTSNAVTTTVATQVTAFVITETTNNDSKAYYTIRMELTGANGENFTLASGVVPRIGI